MKTPELEQILAKIRETIKVYSNGNPDKWFYANRFIFARLQQDERKTKDKIKADLSDQNSKCHYWNCPEKDIKDLKGIHVHRLDGLKGYSLENCVLSHGDCHENIHREEAVIPADQPNPIKKENKEYSNGPFSYWWDITPKTIKSISEEAVFEFIKKDTKEYCQIPFARLRKLLTESRRTSRGNGNWGIRVLPSKQNEIVIEEPGKNLLDCETIQVIWNIV